MFDAPLSAQHDGYDAEELKEAVPVRNASQWGVQQ